MNFNIYKPTKKQYEIILMMVKKPLHECDLLEDYEIEDYKYLDNFYIITHPLIYTIINNESILLPLGFIIFNILEDIYTYSGENYILCYVDARCSFGRWPMIDYHLQAISEMEKSKINIGEILSIFIESHMYQIAKKNKIQKVFLFNLATEYATDYHMKNNWKKNAEKKLKNLININTGKTALEDAKKNSFFIEESNHMFKIFNNI